jgi:hypothetical protein
VQVFLALGELGDNRVGKDFAVVVEGCIEKPSTPAQKQDDNTMAFIVVVTTNAIAIDVVVFVIIAFRYDWV